MSMSLKERRKRRKRILLIRAICRLCMCFCFICLSIFGIFKVTSYVLSAASIEEENATNYMDVESLNKENDKDKENENKKINENLEWNLMLVNASNPIDSEYENSIKLISLKNNQAIDTRCFPYLQRMIDECKAAGLKPVICSSFRNYNRQKELFTEQVNVYLKQGYENDEAIKKAATSVAIPGTSEHEIGLAVDIVDQSNQKVDASQEETDVNKWLKDNSYKYGFILRYPPDSTDITGIIYEPWHFRYVGKEAAKEIHDRNITLEEYLYDR